jgi:hypothetical protein
MKVNVQIERDEGGRLHAYVWHKRAADGFVVKGDDMLKRSVFRNVSSARIECDDVLRKMHIDGIDYTFPADWTE